MPVASDHPESSPFAKLLVAAIFLIGLGQIAMLPPFEGIDEFGHYSSIRQIAETGTIPILGHSSISPDAIDYRAHAPSPYDMPLSNLTPEKPPLITYKQFFADDKLQKDFIERYRQSSVRPPYTLDTTEFNWEAQHPPLYYAAMAPLMLTTDKLPLTVQFFFLRLVSYFLACAGLLVALRPTLKYIHHIRPVYLVMSFLLIPFLMPIFFHEFGRIGNDSLCLFLFGIIWGQILGWLLHRHGESEAIVLGLMFGLGLLTKALFVPIFASFVLFALVRCLRERSVRRFLSLTLICFLAILLSGAWYFIQYTKVGALSGSLDAVLIAKQGGLIAALPAKFSLPQFLAIFKEVVWSSFWFGTESFATLNPMLLAPLFLLAGWIGFHYIRASSPALSAKWLPVWLMAALMAGLIWHVLVSEILGFDFTPGWYFCILAPALAMMVAYGLQSLLPNTRNRFGFAVLISYCVLFLIIGLWAQAAMFAGCAGKGSHHSYSFPNGAYCLDSAHEIYRNMAILAWPNLAIASYIGGFLCLVFGLYKMREFLRSDTHRNS